MSTKLGHIARELHYVTSKICLVLQIQQVHKLAYCQYSRRMECRLLRIRMHYILHRKLHHNRTYYQILHSQDRYPEQELPVVVLLLQGLVLPQVLLLLALEVVATRYCTLVEKELALMVLVLCTWEERHTLKVAEL